MTVIEQILEGIERGRAMYGSVHGSLVPAGESDVAGAGNELCLGDNLEYMKGLIERGYEGKFRLIYTCI